MDDEVTKYVHNWLCWWGVGVISGALLYIREDFDVVDRKTWLQVCYSHLLSLCLNENLDVCILDL